MVTQCNTETKGWNLLKPDYGGNIAQPHFPWINRDAGKVIGNLIFYRDTKFYFKIGRTICLPYLLIITVIIGMYIAILFKIHFGGFDLL